jgi:hypothetical protein
LRDAMVIALTGGPGGGKSTLIAELHAERFLGLRWLAVPESAPLLFRAGLDAGAKSFQRAAVAVQIALEEACAGARTSAAQPLLCHRGTLDPLAYWLRNGWPAEEFFALTRLDRADHHRRYRGVVHLGERGDRCGGELRPLAGRAPSRNPRGRGGHRSSVPSRVGGSPSTGDHRKRGPRLAGQVGCRARGDRAPRSKHESSIRCDGGRSGS